MVLPCALHWNFPIRYCQRLNILDMILATLCEYFIHIYHLSSNLPSHIGYFVNLCNIDKNVFVNIFPVANVTWVFFFLLYTPLYFFSFMFTFCQFYWYFHSILLICKNCSGQLSCLFYILFSRFRLPHPFVSFKG